VYLPTAGAGDHDADDAAAVVWYLPHYLADGRSAELLAAATVDALARPAAAAPTVAVADGRANADAPSPARAPEPLPPALGTVFPPRGGTVGLYAAVGAFFLGELLPPWARRGARALPPPPGPPATAATRSVTSRCASFSAAATARFAAAAAAAGTTVGCGLVGALGVAVVGTGVLPPAAPPRAAAGAPWGVSVLVDARVDAPAGGGLRRSSVGCFVGATPVDVPLPAARGGAAPACGDGWTAAAAVHARVHGGAGGGRAPAIAAMGVLVTALTTAPGRAALRAAVASATEQGRFLPPTVSNVGRCVAVDGANRRAVAGGGGGGPPPTVSAVRLLNGDAVAGAPMVLYATCVGGRLTLCLSTVQPLISEAASAALLASLVRAVEAA